MENSMQSSEKPGAFTETVISPESSPKQGDGLDRPYQDVQASLTSPERLEALLDETELELARLQPEIDALEVQLQKLNELRQAKQKLLSFKTGLQAILNNQDLTGLMSRSQDPSHAIATPSERPFPLSEAHDSTTGKTFLPDLAFEQVNHILSRRDSLNYELFRAIVYGGGQATTEEIRQFLIDNDVRLPSSGAGFEEVPLTDISSRVNYLVRKNVVRAVGNGVFVANLGWE
jgi:hypothetical protein